jgi:hypothetical protein
VGSILGRPASYGDDDLDLIEESQGTTQKGTQASGGGPSIRDAINDGESKEMKK